MVPDAVIAVKQLDGVIAVAGRVIAIRLRRVRPGRRPTGREEENT